MSDVLGEEESADAEQKSSVMSGGAVRLPCCPNPQGLGWRDTVH